MRAIDDCRARSGDARRQAAQKPGLGAMQMDDIKTLAAKHTDQSPERGSIRTRTDRASHGDRHDWDTNAGEIIDELIVAAGVFPAERAGDNRLETTLIQASRDYLHMGAYPGDRRLNDMEDSHTQARNALVEIYA